MKNKNLFWGVLLILTAIFIVFDALGYFNHIGIIKIVFTAILAGITVKGILNINFPLILFPISFICILYSSELGITSLTPWPILLTALLLSMGLSLIFNKPNYICKLGHHKNNTKIINESDSSAINCDVSFGSIVKYINTDDFKIANIDCSLGAAKIYFDNAIITGSSATINLDVSFGGVELYVPKNWNIIQKANVSFGGIDEKNKRGAGEGPTVNLYGEINFSGVTIYYI